MTENKAKIFHLLKEAKNNKLPDDQEKRRSSRYFFLVLALLTVFVIVALFAYVGLQKDHQGLQQTINQRISDSLQRAEELEGEKKYAAAIEMYLWVLGIDPSHDYEIERAVKRLDDKIQHIREVRAYQGKIQIRDLAIRKDKFELKVSGNIVNKGKRPLDEIELTIYCLDEGQKPVCEERLTAVSSDGEPLSRYQKRTFSFLRTYDKREFALAIPTVPASVDEVQVIVTDIAFADE
jgi:cell division protein ZapA (FtsZ GTPase activity inhibitor)